MPPMQAALEGRTALVTGASAGIGAATARALAAAGAHVVLTARRKARLQALAEELKSATALELDVRDAGAVSAALEAHPVDLLVANAGLAFGTELFQDGDPAEWSVMVDTNIKGVLHAVRAALPRMIAAGRGDVVLMGSVAGRQVYPGGNVYNATKYALKGLYEALRLDLMGTGVRLCTVDPAMVETEFSVVRFRGDEEAASKVYDGMRPLTPVDIADAILWAVTRPAHVNVGEIVLWPTDQASTRDVTRRS